MGWIGSANTLYSTLRVLDADRDDKGRFKVEGTIASFLGMGEEYVVGDDACCYVNGKKTLLAPQLGSTGISGITVL